MNLSEIAIALAPAFGFQIGIGQMRRGRSALGAAASLASMGVAVIAAVLGNLRPVVAVLAFGLLAVAFIAEENHRRIAALSCFSAAFVALIVAAMYI